MVCRFRQNPGQDCADFLFSVSNGHPDDNTSPWRHRRSMPVVPSSGHLRPPTSQPEESKPRRPLLRIVRFDFYTMMDGLKSGTIHQIWLSTFFYKNCANDKQFSNAHRYSSSNFPIPLLILPLIRKFAISGLCGFHEASNYSILRDQTPGSYCLRKYQGRECNRPYYNTEQFCFPNPVEFHRRL